MEAERTAFVEVFAAVRPQLEAVAARITGDRHDAADIASEAFVALLERGPRAAADVAPWLFTVTRNRALNRVRDRARAARRGHPVVDEAPPPTLANGPLRRLLDRAAARLGDRDRLALDLRFGKDASYVDIAAALGTTESNARLVVHRASRRFRRETVTLLADHHAAPARCRTTLAQSAMREKVPSHPGCNACTSVVDEVAALATTGAVPLAAAVSAARRALDRLAARVSTRMPVGDHAGRLGESAAALLVAGTVALTLPASVAPPPADTAGRLPTAAAGAPSVARDPASSGPDAPTAHLVAARPGVPGRVGSDAVPAEVAVGVPEGVSNDRSGDGPVTRPLAAPMSQAAPTWTPRAVTDAFASREGQGADIHRFEVATVAGAGGQPTGLRFTIDVDGPPTADMGYTISWAYAGQDGCSSDRLVIDYDADTKPREARWEPSCRLEHDESYESAHVVLPFAIRGSRVVVEVPFESPAASRRVVPGPGVRLAHVFVHAIDYQRPMSLVDGDRAPDSGGLEYRIEREPDPSYSPGTS